MKPLRFIFIFVLSFLLVDCSNKATNVGQTHPEERPQDIWTNPGDPVLTSVVSLEESCERIQGSLQFISIEHLGFDPDAGDRFRGIMSANRLLIRGDSCFYLGHDGSLKDQGSCSCHHGQLTVNWTMTLGESTTYELFFKDQKTVELRYYDDKKDYRYYYFDDQSSLQGKRNTPAKILAEVVPDLVPISVEIQDYPEVYEVEVSVDEKPGDLLRRLIGELNLHQKLMGKSQVGFALFDKIHDQRLDGYQTLRQQGILEGSSLVIKFE